MSVPSLMTGSSRASPAPIDVETVKCTYMYLSGKRGFFCRRGACGGSSQAHESQAHASSIARGMGKLKESQEEIVQLKTDNKTRSP